MASREVYETQRRLLDRVYDLLNANPLDLDQLDDLLTETFSSLTSRDNNLSTAIVAVKNCLFNQYGRMDLDPVQRGSLINVLRKSEWELISISDVIKEIEELKEVGLDPTFLFPDWFADLDLLK